MSERIQWGEPRLQFPKAAKDAYFAMRNIEPSLQDGIQDLGGDGLVAAFGYGSSFSGVAKPDSLMDFILVVDDPKRFHGRNLKKRPGDYGELRSARLQTRLNKCGPNFYSSSLELPRGSQRIKYGVVGLDDFVTQAAGGRKDAHESKEGRGYLYLAGRLQKANLVPIVPVSKGADEIVERAINRARVDGVWLATALLSETFSYEDLMHTYIGLSYLADVRVESPDKVSQLLDNNRAAYTAMMLPLIGQFKEAGVIVNTGMGYKKVASLDREDVESWIKECRCYAAKINYLKNPLTFGVLSGMKYASAKVRRSFHLPFN